MEEQFYIIKDWGKVFENYRSRELKDKLRYVSWPVSQDSEGFSTLSRTVEGTIALGVFGALVQWAARRPREERGQLRDDKGPFTPERYSSRYGLPLAETRTAWLALEGVQWIVLTTESAPTAHRDCTEITPMAHAGREGKGREMDLCVSRTRERTFDPRAVVRLGTVAGQALWDEWCVGSTLPKSNKTASIMAAQRATEFVAEGYWADAGATGSVRDHIDRARDWLRERVSRWRESPLAKKQSESGKIAHATTWFNEQRYNDDDSAWQQTGKIASDGAGKATVGSGSYGSSGEQDDPRAAARKSRQAGSGTPATGTSAA